MLKRVLVSALVAATMATSAMAQSGEPATIPNGPYGDNDSTASLLILVSVQVELIYPRPSGQASKRSTIGRKPG